MAACAWHAFCQALLANVVGTLAHQSYNSLDFALQDTAKSFLGNRSRHSQILVDSRMLTLGSWSAAARKPAAVTVLSGSNSAREWTTDVRENHEMFANTRGYLYKYLNLSDWTSASKGKQPQWLKIHALLATMRDTDSEYILWVDDDIVFTTTGDFVEQMIGDMQEKSLLIARDIRLDQVNTGMMLLRRGQEAINILEETWRLSNTPLGFCPDQSCLHEQEALDGLISRGEVCAHVVNPVNELYNMNTMWRRSHYDESRKMTSGSSRGSNMYLDYDENDPPQQRWRWGMNTAHVSGMTPSCRAPMLTWMARYSKMYVFNQRLGAEEAYKAANPYSSTCLEHLRRKTTRGILASTHKRMLQNWTRRTFPKTLKRSLRKGRRLKGGLGLARPLDLSEKSIYRTQTQTQPVLFNVRQLKKKWPGKKPGRAWSAREDPMGPLAEIVENMLPELLEQGLGPGSQTTRLDLKLNYTFAGGDKSHDFALNLVGQLVLSEGGEYEFITESSNISHLLEGDAHAPHTDGAVDLYKPLDISTVCFQDMRMQSGKAALSIGHRNLSLEFSKPQRGAGVVFNYLWHDKGVGLGLGPGPEATEPRPRACVTGAEGEAEQQGAA